MKKMKSQLLINILRKNNISLDRNIDDFRGNKSPFLKNEYVDFKNEITLEGPCGLYGGPYSSASPHIESGLCSIGAYSYSHSPVPESLSIGRFCSLAKGLRFLDFSHPIDFISSSVAFFKPVHTNKLTAIHHLIDDELVNKNYQRPQFDERRGQCYPKIENDVWIGENVTLAMGITIGNGSIIAANSVVTKSTPPYSILAGNPAKIVKYRFDEKTIKSLLKSEWWEYDYFDLINYNFEEPELFLKEINHALKEKCIVKKKYKSLTLPLE